MNGCAEGLFYQLVQKLSEIGEIEFESMFVDGTKIDAHYFGYKHNVLYHKTLQLHTHFVHIFVRTILISK